MNSVTLKTYKMIDTLGYNLFYLLFSSILTPSRIIDARLGAKIRHPKFQWK